MTALQLCATNNLKAMAKLKKERASNKRRDIEFDRIYHN